MALEDSYAEALRKIVEAGKNPKAAVSALSEVLARRGRRALLSRIARAFSRLVERERAKDTLILSVPGKNSTHAKAEAKGILDVMNINSKDIEVESDETLIGGWRLEGREHLYDASFKKHLLELYKRATST